MGKASPNNSQCETTKLCGEYGSQANPCVNTADALAELFKNYSFHHNYLFSYASGDYDNNIEILHLPLNVTLKGAGSEFTRLNGGSYQFSAASSESTATPTQPVEPAVAGVEDTSLPVGYSNTGVPGGRDTKFSLTGVVVSKSSQSNLFPFAAVSIVNGPGQKLSVIATNSVIKATGSTHGLVINAYEEADTILDFRWCKVNVDNGFARSFSQSGGSWKQDFVDCYLSNKSSANATIQSFRRGGLSSHYHFQLTLCNKLGSTESVKYEKNHIANGQHFQCTYQGSSAPQGSLSSVDLTQGCKQNAISQGPSFKDEALENLAGCVSQTVTTKSSRSTYQYFDMVVTHHGPFIRQNADDTSVNSITLSEIIFNGTGGLGSFRGTNPTEPSSVIVTGLQARRASSAHGNPFLNVGGNIDSTGSNWIVNFEDGNNAGYAKFFNLLNSEDKTFSPTIRGTSVSLDYSNSTQAEAEAVFTIEQGVQYFTSQHNINAKTGGAVTSVARPSVGVVDFPASTLVSLVSSVITVIAPGEANNNNVAQAVHVVSSECLAALVSLLHSSVNCTAPTVSTYLQNNSPTTLVDFTHVASQVNVSADVVRGVTLGNTKYAYNAVAYLAGRSTSNTVVTQIPPTPII